MTGAGTLTLTDFLLERIAEDETDARNAAHYYPDDGPFVRWDSDRVLAECTAKRAIVKDAAEVARHEMRVAAMVGVDAEDTSGALILSHLAAVYADHRDYRQEWSVGA